MLFLKADRVRFCEAKRLVAEGAEHLKALEYRGRLFACNEMFEKSQKKEALQRMRDILDAPRDTMPLLVEDARGYTLWHEDAKLAETNKATDVATGNDGPQSVASEGEKANTIGQLFPTFQKIADRLRSGQDAPKAAVGHRSSVG